MSVSMRTIATLAIAAVFGLIAVILARSYFLRSTPNAPTQVSNAAGTVPVVVAAQPVARGAALQAPMLKVVQYPQNAAPTGAFHAIDQLTAVQGKPRLALRSMVENEPVLPANVSGPGGKLNLSTLVAPGMRAISLQSNDVVGVAGFVLPGDHVDVLLTRSVGSNNQVTQVLASDVRVLGVDQSDNDEANKPVVARAITVEVTPEQAQAISLGRAVGTVSLTLRHVADNAKLPNRILTVADLGGARHYRRRAGSASNIRVVRGLKTSRMSVAVGSSLRELSGALPVGVVAP